MLNGEPGRRRRCHLEQKPLGAGLIYDLLMPPGQEIRLCWTVLLGNVFCPHAERPEMISSTFVVNFTTITLR